MSRQLDQEKLSQLDAQILSVENDKLKDTIILKEEVIDKLYKQYVDLSKNDAGCQTENNIIHENDALRNELMNM